MKKSYLWLANIQTFLSHFFLLIIRLYWGSLLIITGLGKWAHLTQTAEFFTTLNIPAPLFFAWLVALFELIGGISFFLGLFARWMTLPLLVIFFVAYATAHQAALITFFSNPQLFFEQSPFLYLYATLIIFCFGPGIISFDALFEKRLK